MKDKVRMYRYTGSMQRLLDAIMKVEKKNIAELERKEEEERCQRDGLDAPTEKK